MSTATWLYGAGTPGPWRLSCQELVWTKAPAFMLLVSSVSSVALTTARRRQLRGPGAAAVGVRPGVAAFVADGTTRHEGRVGADARVAEAHDLPVGRAGSVRGGVREEAVGDVRRVPLQHPDDLALAVQTAVPDGGGVVGAALDEPRGVDVVVLEPRLELQPPHVGQPAGDVGDLPHRRREHHPREAAEVAAVGGLHVDRARLLQRVDHERDRAAVEERRDDRHPVRLLLELVGHGGVELVLGPVSRHCPHQRVTSEPSPRGGIHAFDVREVGDVGGECEPVVGSDPLDVGAGQGALELHDAGVVGVRRRVRAVLVAAGAERTRLRRIERVASDRHCVLVRVWHGAPWVPASDAVWPGSQQSMSGRVARQPPQIASVTRAGEV